MQEIAKLEIRQSLASSETHTCFSGAESNGE